MTAARVELDNVHPATAAARRTFGQVVLRRAHIHEKHRAGVPPALRVFVGRDGSLTCTCTITGSSYVDPDWDGTVKRAVALAEETGAGTAMLVMSTRHYSWLRGARSHECALGQL